MGFSHISPSQTAANFLALGSGYKFSISLTLATCYILRLTKSRLPVHANGFLRLFWPTYLFGLLHFLKPLELNSDFGSNFEEWRNVTNMAGSLHSCIMYSLSRGERQRHRTRLNLTAQDCRGNSFSSSWNRFNNFCQTACKTWVPGRISGTHTSCQRWYPWAGQTEYTNSLLPLMALQVPNLDPWKNLKKKESKRLQENAVKLLHKGQTGGRINWPWQRDAQMEIRSEWQIVAVVYTHC